MIIRPAALTLPLDTEETYSRPAPFALEIGFGDGRFLARFGSEHPDWNVLGVEVSMGSVWRAYRRLKRENVSNVRIFHGDARFVVRDVLGERSATRIFVNFPDPWPRRRHAGHRLLQQSFFELVSTRLVDGGALALTTDHEDYFRFALDEARRTGLFRTETGAPPEAALATKYARKWLEQEKSIHYALFHKQEEARFQSPKIQTVTMHHAVLSGDLDTVGDFSKLVHAFEGGHVIVLEAFREVSGSGLLFKVLVEEADLRQELIVQAWNTDEGVLVGLQPFGDPLATKGVREAVRVVTGWLVEQGLEERESWI